MKTIRYASLPTELKARLLELARYVPIPNRGDFLRNTVHRLERAAELYPRTLVWATVGALIGRCIHALSGLPAELPGVLIGSAFGLHRDLMRQDVEIEVARVIREELQEHRDRAERSTDQAA